MAPQTNPSHPDPDPQQQAREAAQRLDGRLHAAGARLSGGLSPIALALAYTDWALHLATQPAQSLRLAAAAQRGAWDWWLASLSQQGNGVSDERDLRFSHPAWHQWPYAPVVRAYLGAEAWWRET